MKLNLKKIIIFSVLIIIIYALFKICCYNVFNINIEMLDIKIIGNVTINHTTLSEDEYYNYKDIKVKNIFDEFERNNFDDDYFVRMVKKENSQIVQAIFLGSEEQYINYLDKKVLKKLFINEKVENDIDLIKYIEKHNNDKIKLFMTFKRQRQICALNEFKKSTFPSIEYIKMIDGYYDGYMYKSTAKSIEVIIIKNNKRYFFAFVGDYSEEFVTDFMSYVIIE